MTGTANRRPLKTRGAGWAKALATVIARAGVSPDLISAASVAIAAAGGALMLSAAAERALWPRAAMFAAAAAAIQLRLLCNLLDGMVAVEHGRGSSAGPIWNELPDRFADVILLVAAGYATARVGVRFGAEAGWLCAVLAVLTAYVRELGRGLGFAADFRGPMAKPHRMAALTLACAVSAVEPFWGWRGLALMIGLVVVALGAAFTVARRTIGLAQQLAARGRQGGDA